MGLDPPPTTAENKVELRRSASESRSRDYRFLDTPSFLSPHVAGRNDVTGERKSDQLGKNNNGVKRNSRTKNQSRVHHQNQINQRRFYNTADFFPPEIQSKQQQHQAVMIYGEIERRLRMRGIDEPSKDLETLKHILEALQLKGLLHSSAATTTFTAAVPRRNLISDRESPTTAVDRRRNNTSSSGEPSVSPRRERTATPRTPGRNDSRSSCQPVTRKGGPLSVEVTQRRSSNSPVQSPKIPARSRYDQNQTVKMNRSPRGRGSTAEMNCGGERERERFSRRGPAAEDEAVASTVSETSLSASTHIEIEKRRGEEYREGRSLLERCDKLLHSIAEMNSNPNPNLNLNSVELQQPSPVSVLDSSFYKEDDSPSPVKKRSINFKDQVLPELEDDLWSPSSLSSSSSTSTAKTPSVGPTFTGLRPLLSSEADEPDFIYISEVLRASNYLPDGPDLFLQLEKQISIRGTKEENSKASFLHRRLIFDTVTEIFNRTHRLPPWKLGPIKPSLSQIWAEFQRIRDCGPAQDLFEVIIGVLKKDLAEDSLWGDYPVEMSEAVLDIERLIFKDLIGESIQDLASLAGKNAGVHKHCRKLVF